MHRKCPDPATQRAVACALALTFLFTSCGAPEPGDVDSAGVSSTQEEAAAQELAGTLASAQRTQKALPALSRRAPELDLATAYRVQGSFVASQLKDKAKPSGFKAGLTSPAARQSFGADDPVAGVLLAAGRVDPGAARSGGCDGKPVVIDAGRRSVGLETEVAFIVGAAFASPPADVAELMDHLAAVAPAVEVPDLTFTVPLGELTAVDLVAANVGSYRYLLGSPRPIAALDDGTVDLVSLEARLRGGDGEALAAGRGGDVLGDPREAALWLVRHTLAEGWTIRPGQVLLTGSMGPLVPGRPGTYEADFGALGRLCFELR